MRALLVGLVLVGATTLGAAAPGRVDMECRAELVTREPLTVHFSLVQPAAAAGSLWVPRVLQPVGAFVAAELRDKSGAVVWHTNRPKFSPKLDPATAAAYVEVAPGYSYGTVLPLEGAPAGGASLTLTYSNLSYRGFPGHDLGEQHCTVTIAIP